MVDGIVRALLSQNEVKVSVAVLTQVAREARHDTLSRLVSLLAQAAGAALMASLRRVSPHQPPVECDGPMRVFRGLGRWRRHPGVRQESSCGGGAPEGAFQWRAVKLGFISVLRAWVATTTALPSSWCR